MTDADVEPAEPAEEAEEEPEESWLNTALRWAKYSGIGIGAFVLGTCAGTCSGRPDEITPVDLDGDGSSDIVVQDRGYFWGLFGSEYHPMIQDDGKFKYTDKSGLVERILENKKRSR